MKNKRILQFASLILAALALALQTLAVLFQYDDGTNYFKNGALLPTLALIAALLATAIGTAFAAITKIAPANAKIFPEHKPLPGAIVAGGFAVAALLMILHFVKGSASGIAILTALLSLVAAFYALATALPALHMPVKSLSLLGLTAPLACILFNAYYYFDATVEMNSPVKTATQVGLLCAMLYFVYELRFLMDAPMPRVFLMAAFWVRSLGTLSALAIPVAYLTGKCDRIDYVAGAILTFCVMLTAGLRVQTLLQTAESPAPENENAES